MQLIVTPSIISGKLAAPTSKSFMQRAIVAAALANGTTKIANPCMADDAKNLLKLIEKLGTKVDCYENEIDITGTIADSDAIVNVGESGLAMRMLIPLLSAFSAQYSIEGSKTLLQRKLGFDETILKNAGATIETNKGMLPVSVKGRISGGIFQVDASETSQFLTGLLFALPLLSNDSQIIVENLASRPYIDISLEILAKFGVEIKNIDYNRFEIKGNQKYIAKKIAIEGDWSSASFMLVAAAIAGGVEIKGLEIKSTQADRKILQALKEVGAQVVATSDIIRVKKSQLNAFEFDATHCPDLFPPLVALAMNCEGKSVIVGVERLANKESNRAMALVGEFTKLGGKIKIKGNKMIVHKSKLKAGNVISHGDHRIAMALAVAALNATDGEIRIDNFECVSKSYPMFVKDLVSLGAVVNY